MDTTPTEYVNEFVLYDKDHFTYFAFAPVIYSWNKEDGYSFALEIFGYRLFYFRRTKRR
jgi:hypothetical protein